MRKSFSKIKHIQEANEILEKRVLTERKNRMFELIREDVSYPLINEQGTVPPKRELPCANTAEEILSRKGTLHVGCKGELVKELQERLASAGRSLSLVGKQMIGEKGAWENPTDGNLGPRTKRAIIDFQKETGLSPDGVVGKLTWEKISEYKPEITFDVNNKQWIFKDTFEPVDSSWYSGKERSHGEMTPIAGKLDTKKPPEMIRPSYVASGGKIKLDTNVSQGITNPNEPKSESGKMDKSGYEKLSKEPVKQEGDKYTAWGMGMSPDMATAKKIAILNANTKIKKAGQVGGWYDTEEEVFQENGDYFYFIKMST